MSRETLMKVLLTGPFGNIGRSALQELVCQGHEVTCFARRSPTNEKLARRLKVWRVVWGDLRCTDDLQSALEGQDVVLHNAALIPPRSEVYPTLAYETNVGGTRNVIKAMRSTSSPPRLIYSSSVGLFGRTGHLLPPRTAADPIQPSNHYTSHKALCEKLVRSSELQWAILRFGAAPPIKPERMNRRLFKFVFDIPLETRVEFVHTFDAGLALANAVTCPQVWGKTLLIGGGTRCRMYQRQFIGGMLEATGIGMLPDEAFGTTPFSLDWLDTDESQRLLRYQRLTFDDFLRDMAAASRVRRSVVRVLRPAVRRWILYQSPYYRALRARHRSIATEVRREGTDNA